MIRTEPQWSPVMKTGNTWIVVTLDLSEYAPQWSPVMKTGNTGTHGPCRGARPCLNGARS